MSAIYINPNENKVSWSVKKPCFTLDILIITQTSWCLSVVCTCSWNTTMKKVQSLLSTEDSKWYIHVCLFVLSVDDVNGNHGNTCHLLFEIMREIDRNDDKTLLSI